MSDRRPFPTAGLATAVPAATVAAGGHGALSRRYLLAAIRSMPAAVALVLVAACGKKARLAPPEEGENRYPRAYPKGAPAPSE